MSTKFVLNTERLTECRKKLGLNKIETSKLMGISQPTYVRYENGARLPSIQVIESMARFLNTSAEYLTGQTDSPEPAGYYVEASTDPELFRFIELYRRSDEAKKKELQAYLNGCKDLKNQPS